VTFNWHSYPEIIYILLKGGRILRISKSEAEADAKVKQQFSMYDKNGNGFIEKSEVMTPDESSPPEAPKQ